MGDDVNERDFGRMEGKLDALSEVLQKHIEQSGEIQKELYARVNGLERDVAKQGLKWGMVGSIGMAVGAWALNLIQFKIGK